MSDAPHDLVERVWYGSDSIATVARAALTPLERIFGGIVGARDILYDAGWLPARPVALPAVSVGNLTVGGTGKTPIAAWIARELVTRGASPAVILRGYGDDEPLVHQTLNPDVPVVVGADRVAAIAEAAQRGADVAVLDDAFQHRRARRTADLVVVSADRWTGDVRLLPAGPWREPLKAVRRASLVIITRKAASAELVDEVNRALSAIAPLVPRVSVHLAPGRLVNANDASAVMELSALSGKRVRAILSIGDPTAFVSQIESMGALVNASVYPDHHAFTGAEAAALAGGLTDGQLALCTLKDAVKLGPRWPRLAPPLWYVSQQVMVERGVGGVEHLLDELVHARFRTSPNAGSVRPVP